MIKLGIGKSRNSRRLVQRRRSGEGMLRGRLCPPSIMLLWMQVFFLKITVDIQHHIIFRCYHTVIWLLCTLWSDHHDKSGTHLSPSKVIIILLTAFSMLCFTSPWLIYFVTRSLWFSISLAFLPFPHCLPLWQWSVFFKKQMNKTKQNKTETARVF